MLKVSVIIPVYNSSKYLSICMESILAQTYKNIEIILIDDKSIDDSLNMLKVYQQNHANIKIISLTKNGGVSHARNMGLDSATGDYIIFVDSDDFVDKNYIFKLVAAANKYKADIVDIEMLFWYKRKKKLLTFTEQKRLKKDLCLSSARTDKRSIIIPRYITGKLYKKTVIGRARFDETIRCYEDALFIHQIKDNFNKYVYIKNSFYNYLQRPLSLINTMSTNHMDYLYVAKKIKEIYQNKDYYNKEIQKVIDNILIKDIIVILFIKIPNMKLSIALKKERANAFIKMIEDLSINNINLKYSIILFIFKYNIFMSLYYLLTNKMNLLDLGFRYLSLVHNYQIKDKFLINKVKDIYKKIS